MPLNSKLIRLLKGQIGRYKTKGLPSDHEIDEAFKAHLYKGTTEKASQQHRVNFLDHLSRYDFPHTIDPKTITLENLLGTKGLKLYKLALKEEMNSTAFRDAVCTASTSTHQGKRWAQRPIIFVAGPSGCGKSYASKSIIQKLNDSADAFKKGDDVIDNVIVAADNGIARDISQIRKLAIQVANAQGYQGIVDLHKQSNAILQPMKSHIKNAVLSTQRLGIVFPETFTKWRVPFWNPFKSLMSNQVNKLIFCLIQGEQPDEFKKVVNFLGERRAWKTKDIKQVKFGLNESEGLPESKTYQQQYFDKGVNGSKAALQWFQKNIPSGLHMIEKNTLQLITNEKGELDVKSVVKEKIDDTNMLTLFQKTLGFTNTENIQHADPRLTATQTMKPSAMNQPAYQSAKKYPQGMGLLVQKNNQVTDQSSGHLSAEDNEEIAIQHAIQLLLKSKPPAPHFNLFGKDIVQIQRVRAALLWFKLNNTHYENIHIHSDYGPNQQGNRSIFFKRTETEETFIKQHLKSNFLESFKKSALDNTPIFKKNPANY